jgi:hypothetical protein
MKNRLSFGCGLRVGGGLMEFLKVLGFGLMEDFERNWRRIRLEMKDFGWFLFSFVIGVVVCEGFW